MSLKGIDISSWQSTLNISNIYADFVICKATEGVGYVDPNCDRLYQQAKSAGKLLGVYHFARPDGNDPISEANWFVDNIQDYIGEAILVLDWETNPINNVAWAKQWLDQVYTRTGVRPLIYMSESVVNSYNWSAVAESNYGLWVAKYRDYIPDYNYDMTNAGTPPKVNWWPFYAMWQWTSSGRLDGYSGNLDCNEWYGDANSWRAYAKKPVVTPPEPPKPIEPPVEPPKPVEPPVEPPVTPQPLPEPVTPEKPAVNIVIKAIEFLWNLLKKLLGVSK